MHEMSLCEGILQVIEAESVKQGFSRVNNLWLEIGELAGVEIEALEFCFDAVKRGSLAADEMEKRFARIEPVDSYDAIADADFVIEAVFENMDVKKEVFGLLDGAVKDGAVLATNSSALDIDEIAASTKRPEVVLGTHFFSPANVMKLLEIVRGDQTAPQTIIAAMELGRRIGKTVAVCGNCYGFLANRSRHPFGIESTSLLLEGATPEQVDRGDVRIRLPGRTVRGQRHRRHRCGVHGAPDEEGRRPRKLSAQPGRRPPLRDG